MASNYGSNYARQKMIDDIKHLSEIQKDPNKKLSDNIIKAILHNIAWAWTEQNQIDVKGKVYQAKIRGCKYWTKEAFLDVFQKKSSGNWEEESSHKYSLRHEHIVPKKLFKEEADAFIKGRSKYTINQLKDAMEKCLIGCVVTNGTKKAPEQANLLDSTFQTKMPTKKDFCSITDPWERYKAMKKQSNKFTEIYIVKWKKGKHNKWLVDKVDIKDINQM